MNDVDNQNDLRLFGIQLEAARKAAGLSREEMAQRLGKSYETIWRIESGHSTHLRLIIDYVATIGYQLQIVPRSMTLTSSLAREPLEAA